MSAGKRLILRRVVIAWMAAAVGAATMSAQPAPPTADAKGNTPLMRAAATGSVEEVRTLLGQGANVKAANSLGVTALHLGAASPAKAKLLIEAGADVNAVSQQGRTALHVVASTAGSLETLKLLAAKGADLKAKDRVGIDALTMAAWADDEPMVRYLVEKGLSVNVDNLPGNTPLQGAASHGNLAMMKLLLARKADPNQGTKLFGKVRHGDIQLQGLTPLMLAAAYQPAEFVKVLLDAGASVNAKDCRGMTPLMFAVSSEAQEASVVKLLLERGADKSVKSLAGETAEDWARKFGNPKVLAALGAKTAPMTITGGMMKNSSLDARTAVTRSVGLLERTAGTFFENSGCMACHHSILTAVAVDSARRAGLPVNEPAAAGFRKGISLGLAAFQPALMQMIDPPGAADAAIYFLLGMHAAGAERDATSDALALYVARVQRPNGSFMIGGIARSPIEEGHIHRAALGYRVLNRYFPDAMAEEKAERLGRARRFFETAPVKTTDDAASKLLGLAWAHAPKAALDAAARELLKRQQGDGGWGGNPHLASDAYATGQALYALSESGAMAASDAAYQKGVRYLLETQLPDGSWLVRSRAPKFQPYFESGFPHGPNQWISNAATAWAVAGLAPAAR